MGKNLAQLILDARTASNTQRSKFVTDDEIGNYINRGWRELYDLIVSADKSFYNSSTDVTFASGSEAAATVNLPSDFYLMRGLELYPDTIQARPVYAREFSNRQVGELGYFFGTGTISIGPYQLAVGPARITYVPKPLQFGVAIDVAAGDSVVASTGVWTFQNGHFTAGLVGQSLTVAGTSTLGNSAARTITAVSSPTSVTTAAASADETFTAAVTASIAATTNITQLDQTADNFDDYLSVFAAVRIIEKKKQSPAVLMKVLDDIRGRVSTMAPERSAEPEAAPVLWSPSMYPYRGMFPGTPWD